MAANKTGKSGGRGASAQSSQGIVVAGFVLVLAGIGIALYTINNLGADLRSYVEERTGAVQASVKEINDGVKADLQTAIESRIADARVALASQVAESMPDSSAAEQALNTLNSRMDTLAERLAAIADGMENVRENALGQLQSLSDRIDAMETFAQSVSASLKSLEEGQVAVTEFSASALPNLVSEIGEIKTQSDRSANLAEQLLAGQNALGERIGEQDPADPEAVAATLREDLRELADSIQQTADRLRVERANQDEKLNQRAAQLQESLMMLRREQQAMREEIQSIKAAMENITAPKEPSSGD